jgi:hypothetical protein
MEVSAPNRGLALTARIFLKLTAVVLGLLIVAVVASDILAARVASSNYIRSLTRDLIDEARLLARARAGDLSGMKPDEARAAGPGGWRQADRGGAGRARDRGLGGPGGETGEPP